MKTVYEVGLFNLNIEVYLCAMGIVIFIFLLVHHMKNIRYIKRNKYKRIDFAGFILAVIALMVMVVRGMTSHYMQYNDLKAGNYETVEGKISGFQKDVKNDGTFSINGVEFEVNSKLDGSEFFNSNKDIEDLARDQHLVKIYYSGENILKIEYQE